MKNEPSLTDIYPLPWTVKFAPEYHNPAKTFDPPIVSGTGNIITGQSAIHRGANEIISSIVASNGEELNLDSEYGGLSLSDAHLAQLVELLNRSK